jgi:hypothetical protein
MQLYVYGELAKQEERNLCACMQLYLFLSDSSGTSSSSFGFFVMIDFDMENSAGVCCCRRLPFEADFS